MACQNALVTVSPVSTFISYSRADFYFAESLALHLSKSGVPAWLDARDLKPGHDWWAQIEEAIDTAPAVVLVMSKASATSTQVQRELRRAQVKQKRIVVARFRAGTLPPGLDECEEVDFRGPFAPAIKRLSQLLLPLVRRARETDAAVDTQVTLQSRWSTWMPLPPAVLVIAAMLAALTILPLTTFNYYELITKSVNTTAEWIRVRLLVPAILALWIWHGLIAFLRRHMSLTRLVAVFGFFVIATAWPLIQFVWANAVPAFSPPSTMAFVGRAWGFIAALNVTAVAGIAVVSLMRPSDLLRWAPTGRAWDAYRTSADQGSETSANVIPSPLRLVSRFRVTHDPFDAPTAAHVRDVLRTHGATDVTDARGRVSDHTTTVLLLSNRTRLNWLQSHVAQDDSDLLVIAFTNIVLPARLEWLWRRQWLDFRRWQIDPSVSRLLTVPESLSRLRLPRAVTKVHHLLCLTAAAVFTCGGALTRDAPVPTDSLNLSQVLAVFAASSMFFWAVLARRVIGRLITASQFKRHLRIAAAVSLPLSAACLRIFVASGGSVPRAVVVGAFLAWTPLWIWRHRDQVTFWLPQASSDTEWGKQTMAPKGGWRTLVLVGLYTWLWTAIVTLSIDAADPYRRLREVPWWLQGISGRTSRPAEKGYFAGVAFRPNAVLRSVVSGDKFVSARDSGDALRSLGGRKMSDTLGIAATTI